MLLMPDGLLTTMSWYIDGASRVNFPVYCAGDTAIDGAIIAKANITVTRQ